MKIYVSLPISGHDIKETKEYVEKVKKFLEEKGDEIVTPFDVCDEEGESYSYYIGALKHFWNVMLFSLYQIGRNQRVVWQNLSWQEFMERKF